MKNNTSIRRISNYNPVLTNKGKHSKLTAPFELYKTELQRLVDQLLYNPVTSKFAGKDITSQITLPERLSQVLAKQAIGMAKSIQNKVKLAENAGNKQKYQQEIIDAYNSGQMKIDITKVNIELDSRFVDIQPAKDTAICDYWVKITSFPKGSFLIPLKLTNHMKDLIRRGFELKTNSIRVNASGTLGFYFIKQFLITPKTTPKLLGIDIGRNKAIVSSCGNKETTHLTGKKINQLLGIVQRKDQTSKNSRQTRTNIKQQINYSLKNDIDWENTDILVIENLTDMKRYTKWGKKSHFWRVAYIQTKIQELCEENNVWLTRVNPAYTSIDCSGCGHRKADNRNGEKFACGSCGLEIDADLNAAINIHTRGANSPSVKKYLNLSTNT